MIKLFIGVLFSVSYLAELVCIEDRLVDLRFVDIGEEECFCGRCPYLFRYVFLLNYKQALFDDVIYLNEIRTEKRNWFTGKNLVRIYSGSDDFLIYLRRNCLIVVENLFTRNCITMVMKCFIEKPVYLHVSILK